MGGEKKGMKALEVWCRQITNGYKDVNIANMTTAFRDGLAFCALIHHFRPDLVDFESLSKENIFYNNNLAFSIAEQKLGIPALLDAEDMVQCKVPDRLSIMTYVSQFYNYFEGIPAKSPMKRAFKEQHGEQILVGPPVKIFGGSKQVPSSIGLGKRQEQCESCKNRVYILERLIIENKLYHRTCFKCDKCKTLLKPGSYVEGDEPNTYECVMCPHEERAGFDFSFKSSKVEDEKYSTAKTNANASSEKYSPESTAKTNISSEKYDTDDLKIQSNSTKLLKNFLNESKGVEVEETVVDSITDSDQKHCDVKGEMVNRQSYVCGESSQSETSRKSSFESDPINQKDLSYEVEADSVLEALESENESSSSSNSDSDEDESKTSTPVHKKFEEELEHPVIADTQNTDEPIIEIKVDESESGQRSDENVNKTDKSDYSNDEEKPRKPPIPKKPIFQSVPSLIVTHEINANTDDTIVCQDFQPETENNFESSKAVEIEPSPCEIEPQDSLAVSATSIDVNKSEEEHSQIVISQCTIDLKMPDKEQNSSTQIVLTNLTDNVDSKEDADMVLEEKENDNRSDVEKKNIQPSELNVQVNSAEKRKSLNPFESDEEDDVELESQGKIADTTNPFGDSEDEEESVNPKADETKTKISTNPFGDSDSDDEIEASNKTDETNPFADDEDKPHDDTHKDNNWIQSVFGISTLKPANQQVPFRPVPKPRSMTLSNSTMSGTGTLTSRKKKRAPLPPGVGSTPESSPKPSPRLKKAAPAPSPSPSRPARANSGNSQTLPPKLIKPKNEDEVGNVDEIKENKNSDDFIKPSTPAKLTFGYWKKKKKAPPIPVTVKRQISKIPLKELQQELAEIEEKQLELEYAGVEIEKQIRDMSEEEASQAEEDLIMQLFDLVNKKNILFRRQADLMYLKRQNRLEEEHTELEYQIRLLMQRPAHLKTDFDKEKEEELLARLLEVVELRNDIIDSQERDRLRITAEEKGLEEEISAQKQNDEKPESKKKSKKKKVKKEKKKKKDTEEKKDKKSKKLIKLKLT